jgi:hypothetical protein
MILFVLYLLALLDAILCGYRAGAGRCALIYSERFSRRSMWRGFLVVQVVSTICLGVLLIAVYTSPDRNLLIADLEQSANRMVRVFVVYAALVLANLALRLIPSVDIRSATSVLALGPLTALRPFVMIAGTTYGIWSSKLPATKLLGALVLAFMLGTEWFLNRIHDRIQQRELQELIPAKSRAKSAAT